MLIQIKICHGSMQLFRYLVTLLPLDTWLAVLWHIRNCPVIIIIYYPHMPVGKVWIYHLLFVFFVICVCLYGYGLLRPG